MIGQNIFVKSSIKIILIFIVKSINFYILIIKIYNIKIIALNGERES